MRIFRSGKRIGSLVGLGLAAAISLLLAGTAAAQTGQRQMPQPLPGQPLIDEHALTRVSEHVYAIVGWPNIGIVVGNRATLVIDTRLGERSGATIMGGGIPWLSMHLEGGATNC